MLGDIHDTVILSEVAVREAEGNAVEEPALSAVEGTPIALGAI